MDVWYTINETKDGSGKEMFKNMIVIVKYIMTLFHSSAIAEQLFSQLSLLRTKLRNWLHIVTVTDALQIYIRGTDIK